MVEFPKLLDRFHVVLLLLILVLHQNLNCCFSLNDEGLALLKFRDGVVSDPFGGLANWNDEFGEVTPCSWNGIECADGNVVSLNLKDMGLRGSIAPDLANLIHIKSIILRNNSFYGTIPEDITKLKELEILDLGYNNLSGALPPELGNNLSLTILLLDNNGLFSGLSPEIYELQRLSEAQVDEKLLRRGSKISSYVKKWNIADSRDIAWRRMLQSLANVPKNVRAIFKPPQINPNENAPSPSPALSPSPSPSPFLSPSPSPSPSLSPFPSSSLGPSFSPKESSPSPVAPASEPSLLTQPESPSISVKKDKFSRHHAIVLPLAIGGSVLLLLLVAGVLFCRSSKVSVVKPWATGLSGQLQKAFVTGVPKLNRSELVTACEDFSNVIGTTASGTLYKGTLSSGVEIAVIAFSVESAKDWSKTNEIQFRKKIETLSKVNHKNFVNLLGYCEEEQPFTRMLVFEYAPNGTLFEHLHIKEAEPLDWASRMRILMGIAYCLQHMHQLSPPITHKKLNSSAVYLTEDYAAKVSDFTFWNEMDAAEVDSTLQGNVYSFGALVFEMVTGQLPYTVDRSSFEDWASDYMGGGQPLRNVVDPTLKSFHDEQLERIDEIMKACVNPDPRRRPEMREITASLREITAIGPDAAVPRLSPLWWAELEILSAEAN